MKTLFAVILTSLSAFQLSAQITPDEFTEELNNSFGFLEGYTFFQSSEFPVVNDSLLENRKKLGDWLTRIFNEYPAAVQGSFSVYLTEWATSTSDTGLSEEWKSFFQTRLEGDYGIDLSAMLNAFPGIHPTDKEDFLRLVRLLKVSFQANYMENGKLNIGLFDETMKEVFPVPVVLNRIQFLASVDIVKDGPDSIQGQPVPEPINDQAEITDPSMILKPAEEPILEEPVNPDPEE